MPVLDQQPGLRSALSGDMTPKFLATRSMDGIPNVVPLISLMPAEEPDMLLFGNFLLRKSIKNLEADRRVGILVITPELQGWSLKGDFSEFQRTGPYVERQMSGPLLRYNAYTGIRNAGILHVHSVTGHFALSKPQVLKDYALARMSALLPRGDSAIMMPLAVRNEFGKLTAIKVMAWIESDGYPAVIPLLSLQPAGERHLVAQASGHANLPSSGAMVAANILTLDAVSYQVKGKWSRQGATGIIQIQEIYAGGPPYPGGRIA